MVSAISLNITRASVFIVLAFIMISTDSAVAQGLSGPGSGSHGGSATDALRGAFAEQTPEQRRAFCGRVAQGIRRTPAIATLPGPAQALRHGTTTQA